MHLLQTMLKHAADLTHILVPHIPESDSLIINTGESVQSIVRDDGGSQESKIGERKYSHVSS